MKLLIWIIGILAGFLIVVSCYDTYQKMHYATKTIYQIQKVNDLQKELSDFANNQREFYKKTH